jgi:molecular chaperone HtpG
MNDPIDWIHSHAEGVLEYTTLFYFPKTAPMDLYRADYKPGVKLFVNRVFITDDENELLPTWLRFVRGIIDSSDLPLNVSREILQQNKVLSKIRSNSVKKILEKINLISKDDKNYLKFYLEYGRMIKEGVYQDYENKEALLELLRFKSTTGTENVSLKDYVDRMQTEQKSIFYLVGENETSLRQSPLLEMYKMKGIEVLLLDDEVDEVIMPVIPKYKDYDLKAVNRSSAADELKNDIEFFLESPSLEIAYFYASESIKSQREILLKILEKEKGWRAVQNAPKKLRSDKEIILKAIKIEPVALTFADKKLHSDKDLIAAGGIVEED